ncbi:hypothetical protein, conserved [Babesia ovata]|uniref:Uncharacterized protein n=1 Tax=Babesia ovata TaxID=189622 RepID=A0A2H6KJB9_9APIC|nr:uncharacterized protein BOVATA_045850 [Babesia ovata]GBE63092.1 hypothetical protein, conserved [Babesia ovata]
MVYTSLTEAPRNLKEGIDWLIALKETCPENNLLPMGVALYDLFVDKPVGKREQLPSLEKVKNISKEFLEQEVLEYQPFVQGLLDRFSNPTTMAGLSAESGKNFKSEYEKVIKARGAKPETIAEKLGKVVASCERFLKSVKIPDQYESAYSSEATWEASCAKDPEACAVLLVGIAPMLYAGLRSLQVTSHAAFRQGRDSWEEEHLEDVLRVVGYKEPECRVEMSGPRVNTVLRRVDLGIFTVIHDLAGVLGFY